MTRLNEEKCVGCGRCVEACPSGFEMRGEKAVLKDPEADCVARAIAVCPVGAITAGDPDGRKAPIPHPRP
jgi:ferredoxin